MRKLQPALTQAHMCRGFRTLSTSAPRITDWSSKEYQYLEQSPVPTEKFLASLPRLPIPKLDSTCDKYLSTQKPLLDQEQFIQTKGIVDRFRTSGKDLDDKLRAHDKANKHTSYINAPW
jgi:carnitine O-palmitoyltransferase 2